MSAGAAPDAPILYVHPGNHPFRWVVPVGAIAAVNLLPGGRLGRYADEVTAAEIAAARVVLVDVHWSFPMAVLRATVEAVRRVNPRASLVAGGLTAAFFGESFRREYDLDYVLTGDVEISLPRLVEHLLAGEAPPPLPGVFGTGWRPAGPAERLSQAAFDSLDWLSLDWFPAYRRHVVERHARHRPGDLDDNVHPFLPVSRGCIRSCRFCAGGFQSRVFGPAPLVRSPSALRRDLLAVAADDGLSFVSVFLSDASLLRHYAPMLSGERFELDANVFFCGTPDPDALRAVRGAFAGSVHFSVIQPSDLAPLEPPRKPPPAGGFETTLRHLDRMERTRCVVYHVGERPDPSIEAVVSGSPNLRIQSGEDWNLVRPLVDPASEEGWLDRQMADVLAAAEGLAAAHFLRDLVPGLARHAIPVPLEIGVLAAVVEEGRGDAVERGIALALLSNLRRRRRYGFDLLELGWSAATEPPASPAAWVKPGLPLRGEVAWRAGLRGFEWSGWVDVDPQEAGTAVAVLPVAGIEGVPVFDPRAWARSRLPAVAIPGPGRRRVELGGSTGREGVELWLRDGSTTRRARLAAAPPAEADPGTPSAAFGPLPVSPWPDPSLVPSVLAKLRSSHHGPDGDPWVLSASDEADGRVLLHLQFRSGGVVPVALFPRPSSGGFVSTGRFSVAYRSSDRERFESGIREPLLALLRSVE